jgi:hypothetical protein
MLIATIKKMCYWEIEEYIYINHCRMITNVLQERVALC